MVVPTRKSNVPNESHDSVEQAVIVSNKRDLAPSAEL